MCATSHISFSDVDIQLHIPSLRLSGNWNFAPVDGGHGAIPLACPSYVIPHLPSPAPSRSLRRTEHMLTKHVYAQILRWKIR
jgi:hypothetical protein